MIQSALYWLKQGYCNELCCWLLWRQVTRSLCWQAFRSQLAAAPPPTSVTKANKWLSHISANRNAVGSGEPFGAAHLDWSCWRGSGPTFWGCESGPSCSPGSRRTGRWTGPGWCNQSPPPGPRARTSGWWCWLPEWIAACGLPASTDQKQSKGQHNGSVFWAINAAWIVNSAAFDFINVFFCLFFLQGQCCDNDDSPSIIIRIKIVKAILNTLRAVRQSDQPENARGARRHHADRFIMLTAGTSFMPFFNWKPNFCGDKKYLEFQVGFFEVLLWSVGMPVRPKPVRIAPLSEIFFLFAHTRQPALHTALDQMAFSCFVYFFFLA